MKRFSTRQRAFVMAALACSAFATPEGTAQTRTLTVRSMPSNPLGITVSPADLSGSTGAQTVFTRQYANGSSVVLTAPATSGANSFVKWQRNGGDYTTATSATVSMNADITMNAVYYSNRQVLTNGSFESGFTGWTTTGNLGIETTAPFTPTDGTKLAGFNGGNLPPNGTLSQTFPTTVGGTYTLAFDVGTMAYTNSEQRLRVAVDGAGSLLLRTESVFGAGGGASTWSAKSYTFTANSPTTTLRFTDISTTSDIIDLILDNVRVNSSISGTVVAPQTVNDTASIHSGQKIRVPVLANDIGIIDQSTLSIVTPPAIGTVSVDPVEGTILYAHPGNDTAPVSFSYRVSGEGGQSPPATVTISIASTLRIPNTRLNVPIEPPKTAVQMVPALPGVSFTVPMCIASPPADTKRIFVGELGGKIKVVPDVTATTATSAVALDLVKVITIPARTPAEAWNQGTTLEAGLLGIAFHPNYASNGHLFVAYMVTKANDPGVWYQRLSRFTVSAAQRTQPAPVIDPASERVFIEQRDRNDTHNAGDIHFGTDGYLYMSLGDEGNAFDSYKNSQRIDMNFFGAMLRIDVDKKPGNLEPSPHINPTAASLGYSAVNAIPRDEIPAGSGNFYARYSIPVDNPYVHTSKGGSWNGTFNGVAVSAANLPYVRSEFWAVGLRSPWRFSIDDPTGDIWLGDVGQNYYEELDLITKGGNYGWGYFEGLHSGPRTPPAGFLHSAPILEYAHTFTGGDPNYTGNSVIGGVVYRGTRFPGLYGAYIFGDFISGNIWSLTRPGGVTKVQRITGQSSPSAFGTDPSNGDVLICDINGARIMRLVATSGDSGFPTTLSATGLFADLTDLSPAPGVLPYQPNLTFWSDYAVKRRWFTIPDSTSKMTWTREGAWTYPSGQIWVKHFDMETERGNSASPKKRLETRILVKNDAGVYGVSYKWNAAGTEATLVPDGGEEFNLNLTVNGAPYTQRWSIPSRSQCITCHSPKAGHALSFNTRQLNLDSAIHNFEGNQIDLLKAAGYFANSPDAGATLPRHAKPNDPTQSLESKARSYIAVNCSYCHAGANGTAPSQWDGRPELTLSQTGMVNGNTSVGGAGYKLIAPADPAHSVILQRAGATNGFTRMPPLGSNEIDNANLALLTDWINQLPPNPNDAPVATGDSYAVTKDTPLVIAAPGVLANDSDPEGLQLTAIRDTSPARGSLTLNPDGSFTYTPETGYIGPDSFTYHANDGTGNSGIVTVNLTVSELVLSPFVNGSFESNFTGWTTTGNIVIQSAAPYVPTDGTRIAAFNSAQSTPNGTVSQTFSTIAGQTYTLAFDAGALAFTTSPQVLGVTVTGNGSLLSQTVTINGPGGGNVRWLPQSFTFVANSALSTLTFRDQSSTSDAIDLLLDKVRVTSQAPVPNVAPVAVADSYSVTKDTALVVPASGVLGNDSDANSNPLTALVDDLPTHGSLTLNTNGGFTYTPETGYTGPDSFTYHANDGTLNSNVVTVSLTVSEAVLSPFVNGSFESNFTGWTTTGNIVIQSAAPYVPTDGTRIAAFNSGQSAPNGTVSQTFSTIAGQTYTLAFDAGALAFTTSPQVLGVTVTGNGSLLSRTVTVNGPGGGNVRWLPQSFTFVANSALSTLTFRDQSSTSDAIDLLLDKVRVTSQAPAPNVAPVAVADTYSVIKDTALNVPASGVLGNDSDANSNPLTAIVDDLPAHGSLTLNSNGGFTYTPEAGYTGPDSFTYHANDGSLNSNVVTVNLTIAEFVAATLVNGSFESNFTGWTTTGNVVIQSAAPYVPTDGTKLAAFNSTQSTPNGVLSQSFATVAGQTYTLAFDAGALSYNTNPQVLGVTITGNSSVLSRTVTVNGPGGGNVRWLPQSFTFVANSALSTLTFRDQSPSSDAIDLLLDKVSIATRVNTAPVAVANSYTAIKDTPLVIAAAGVLANDSDADGGALTAIADDLPTHGSLTLNTNGGFTYTPEPGYTGPDSFTYHANDGSLNSNVVTVNLTVTEVIAVSLANGSFESGFTGWTTTGNVAIQGAAPYAPTDGTKLAAFNSGHTSPNGTVSQSINTVAGQTYTLQFDAGVLAFNTSPQTMGLTVTGSASLLNRTITINGAGGGNCRWLAQSFTFVADSALSTITFRDQSPTTEAIDLLLDKVRISAAPTIASTSGSSGDGSYTAAALPIIPEPAETLGTATFSSTAAGHTIQLANAAPGDYVLEASSDLGAWEKVDAMTITTPQTVEFHHNGVLPGESAPATTLFYRIGKQSSAAVTE